MSGLNRRWGLRQLGAMAAASEVDRALQRSCIGRIVSLLTFIFIVLCIVLYALTWYGLIKTGLAERLPQPIGGAVGLSIFVGFFVAIILAGLIGNWLRRRIWRMLLRRSARR